MSQLVERTWPYLLAVTIGALWWFGFGRPFPNDSDGLLAASGGASAVLVGFLATAKTVILSVSSSDVFKRLKDGGFHELLFNYLYEAIVAGMFFLLVSILGFFVTRTPAAPDWFSLVWVVAGLASLFSFARITHLLFKMLKWV